jgi:hypothetical protein
VWQKLLRGFDRRAAGAREMLPRVLCDTIMKVRGAPPAPQHTNGVLCVTTTKIYAGKLRASPPSNGSILL